MSDYHPSPSPPSPDVGPSYAPHRHLPKQAFTSVEYPGPVSHPSALLKVVTQEDLNDCFNAPSAAQPILEMRYRMDDPTVVPVRGSRVPSQKLLLKITRRRKREANVDRATAGSVNKGKEKERDEGLFMAEIVGPLTHTVRFRALADYHYTPRSDGRISSILTSLRDLDYDAILDYQVPQLDEAYIEPIGAAVAPGDIPFRSLLDLQPQPMFTDRRVPPFHNFKIPPQAVIEEVEDEGTGQRRFRYINKARFVGFTPTRIGHIHDPSDVPTEPPKSVLPILPRLDQALLDKMRAILEKRPVWQRFAFLAQFPEHEQRVLKHNKAYFPAVVYTISAGPYSRSLIRLGYDPCADPAASIYQRIHFYVQVNRARTMLLRGASPDTESEEAEDIVDKSTKSWWEAEQERRIVAGLRPPLDKSREYIFDGQMLHRDRPDYSLCDITDPLIERYIRDPANVTDMCDPHDGWYKPTALNLIRSLVRIKYLYVREKGEPAPDSLCFEAIESYEREMEAERVGTAGPDDFANAQAQGMT